MKITPIAAGNAGTPGTNIGSVEIGRTASPERIAKAVATASGQEYKPQEDPQVERLQHNVRTIKMRTQVSPEAYQEEAQDPAQANEQTTESSTPTTIEEGQEVTKPLSPQLAALAREKRAAQVMKAEAQKLMAEAEAKLAASTDVIPTSRLKSETLKVLEEAGLLDSAEFYNSLTERIVNGASNPEIEALKAELKSLKEGVETRFVTQQEQAEEAALTEMLGQAEALAKEGDSYELIRERNAFDRVLRKIHSTYKQTGQVLDVSEAMDQVENEIFTNEVEPFLKTNKVQSRFAQPTQQLQPQQKTMRTLTARDNATVPASRKARALAAFHGTLKK